MEPLRIAMIIGSTRPNRIGPGFAQWAHEMAQGRDDMSVDLLDLVDFDLPLLNEPAPAGGGEYTTPHAKKWSRTIAQYDGFVFVTPEYNSSMPASLKNAIDYLHSEWADKSAGIISYGGTGGVRSAHALRLVLGQLSLATVRATVSLTLREDMKDGVAAPRPHQDRLVTELLDSVGNWGRGMRFVRGEKN